MNFVKYLAGAAVLGALCVSAQGRSAAAESVLKGEVDFSKTLLPAPLSSKFMDEAWYIWCGTVVKGEDGKYHMFYSRWPRENGHYDWVNHSEVAHALSDSPAGPWRHAGVALPPRGKEFWDGTTTHNPTVHKFAGKYYIYYTGNCGDGKITKGLNWSHRNTQRIGVAVAESPYGPWERFDRPIIDVGPEGSHDELCIANPSVTQMNDGRYLMVYKAVAKQRKMPAGGPVIHLTAVADRPEGPFVKQNAPIFTSDNPEAHFPAEDPYIWNQDGVYYAIVKDMRGFFTDRGRSLALFFSKDGFDWKLAKHPLVSATEVRWEDGSLQKLSHLERPQLFIEGGVPKFLILAADGIDDGKRGHSFNLTIPLNWQAGSE